MTAIRLHPEFGLNPCIPTCFWCSKPKSEVALLGAKYRGQAPLTMVLDYGPCDECKKGMALGIACIEVDSQKTLNRPPLAKEGALSTIAPTGRWCVIAEDQAAKLPFPEPALESIRQARRALLDVQVFNLIFDLKEEPDDDQDKFVRLQERGEPGPLADDTRLPQALEPA